ITLFTLPIALGDSDVTLTFTYWGSTYEKAVIENAIQSFTEKTGIKVEPMIIPTEYETKLTTMIAGNDAPDVGYLGPPTAYKWFNDGQLYDIKELFESNDDTKEEDYIDGAIFRSGDSIVGIMNNLESFAIFYNKELFDAAGIENVPTKPEDAWTWEEFVDITKRLTLDANGRNANDPEFDAENIVQYGVYMGLWSGTFEALLLRNGTQYFPGMGDETAIGTEPFNHVFQNIADLMHVHHSMPTPTAAESMPAPAVSLQSRRYAMVIDGQWVCNDLAPVEELDYGIAVLPKMTDTTAVYSGALGVIFSGTDHPQEAWQLLQHITSVEASTELFNDGLWMPNRKIYYTDAEKIDLWAGESRARVAGYRDVLVDPIVNDSEVTGEVYVKNFGDIGNILYPALDQVWAGEKNVNEVMEEIMPRIEPLLEGSIR
ncbi:MAG: sugar ABC transporter substrate-binding protein, partial [Clostridiales bacterium]|nr:sugar ABC transporter substrate-binding protein [Clostridiales bacterium]